MTIVGDNFKDIIKVKKAKFGNLGETPINESYIKSDSLLEFRVPPPNTTQQSLPVSVRVTLLNSDEQESTYCIGENCQNCQFTYDVGKIKIEPFDKHGGRAEGPATGQKVEGV